MSRLDHADFCNKDHQPGTTPCARIVQAPVDNSLRALNHALENGA